MDLAQITVNCRSFLQKVWDNSSEDERSDFLNNDAIHFHFTVGMPLRNECLWGCSDGNGHIYGKHVDDWSHHFIIEFQQKKIKESNKS